MTDEKVSVNDAAELLGVTTEAIKKHIRELFPCELKNGIKTFLDQEQITEIKKKMRPTTQVVAVQTDIEMIEKTKDVISWLNLKLTEEKQRREIAENRVKRLTHNSNTFTTGEIAKELNMRSAQELNKALHARGIQYKDSRGVWVLYADYADKGLVNIKQKEINGKPRYYREWTGIGRDYIIGIFKEAIES